MNIEESTESWANLPNDVKEDLKKNIKDLLDKYEEVKSKNKLKRYNEEDVKIKFINPLLEALGWDVRGVDEVKFEQRTLTGRTDFGLRTSPNKRPAIFYEIKRFKESLDGGRKRRGKKKTYPEIAIEDAWQMKVDWTVLTNFKKLRLYQTHVKKPEEGLIFEIELKDFLEEESLSRLWDLSKSRIKEDSLIQYEKRRTRKDITTEVTNDLYLIRKSLSAEINEKHKLDKDDLREGVQRIIDRLVVIRTAEDRNIIPQESLHKMLENWQQTSINKNVRTLMKELKNLFRDFDSVYNSALFEEHPCENWEINNNKLESVIEILYKYNFELIDADVLGSIYEDYIGHILEEKEDDLDIKESYESRKSGGIYYTPIPLVTYCVEHTLGNMLADAEDPSEISNMKIVDPACGSGSFLIKSFEYLEKWYNEYNEKLKQNGKKENINSYSEMVEDVGIKIIKENIFGVDLDHQSVEIASVNLMLKALKRNQKLPLIMDENIKQGNSLIFEDNKYSENVFSWEEEFSEIIEDKGGFDVVIGNPPWGANIDSYVDFIEDNYDLAKGEYDSFELFFELSNIILADGGYWAFVIPDSIFNSEHLRTRKYLAENFAIQNIIKLGEGFFEGVYRSAVIVILKKDMELKKNNNVNCLTLMKEDREKIKRGLKTLTQVEKKKGHQRSQNKFLEDENYEYNISISNQDEKIMNLMEEKALDNDEVFEDSRGVEFSQDGHIIKCPNCFKWDTPPKKVKGEYDLKECSHCSHEYEYDEALSQDKIVIDERKNEEYERFLKGESVNRYYLKDVKYIDTTKEGINYKDESLYEGEKILIRKTGVGLYATVDKKISYVPQVVFIFKPKENIEKYDIEYFLGILNSRLMLYYYYKRFGDLEWKSFPYLTQSKVKKLPFKRIDFNEENEKKIHDQISEKVEEILEKSKDGEVPEKLDYEIEELVMDLYEITPNMKQHIWEELDKVQDLRIIRETMN